MICLRINELEEYFNGRLREFKTPVHFVGTAFQQRVWKSLCTIPYGETGTYAQQAQVIGRPFAYRAVANANAANHCAIIVPCHRIIKSNGDLCGYAGGVERKRWLLAHEQDQ